ncbi:hypothetical protein BC833DRAFT_649541 [Globomyces pollinis-pini]|nr:hypothetical protein BC833DRAFT_649541 [Globomyces pollinis-pini]
MSALQVNTQKHRLVREHTHSFSEKGITPNGHPTMVFIQVHSIALLSVESARITVSHRSNKHTVSSKPYAHKLSFPLNYHALMFDVVKVYILKQVFLSHTKVAQTSIKLSDLPQLHGDSLYTFDLVDVNNKSNLLGTIDLKITFDFSADELTFNMPYVESPMAMSNLSGSEPGSAQPSSANTDSQLKDMVDVFNEYSLEEGHDSLDVSSENSDSMSGRRPVRTLSTNSVYTKRSYKEGLDAITQLLAAVGKTGWSITNTEFARGLAMLQKYYKRYPNPKTFDVVIDTTQIKIGTYFLNFIMPSYGAAVLNYFGYGKLTDVFKLNQNKKAIINHLKIESKHLLVYDYGSNGLFNHKPAFYVVWDVKTQALVVTIRGTFGVADAITDLNCEYCEFMGGSAHAGSVQSALWMQHHYMDKFKEWIETYKPKGVYFLGHSLGGAVAAMCTIVLREELQSYGGEDMDVKSYGYGTPPVLSIDLTTEYKENIVTYINEYDIIPKMSYGSFLDLRDLIILTAELHKKKELTLEQKLEQIHELNLELKKSNKHPRLFVPGQSYFIYKTSRVDPNIKHTKKGLRQNNTGHPLIDDPEPHYVIEKSIPEFFDDLHLKIDMIFFHFPNKYDRGMRESHDWLIDYFGKHPEEKEQ